MRFVPIEAQEQFNVQAITEFVIGWCNVARH